MGLQIGLSGKKIVLQMLSMIKRHNVAYYLNIIYTYLIPAHSLQLSTRSIN